MTKTFSATTFSTLRKKILSFQSEVSGRTILHWHLSVKYVKRIYGVKFTARVEFSE